MRLTYTVHTHVKHVDDVDDGAAHVRATALLPLAVLFFVRRVLRYWRSPAQARAQHTKHTHIHANARENVRIFTMSALPPLPHVLAR